MSFFNSEIKSLVILFTLFNLTGVNKGKKLFQLIKFKFSITSSTPSTPSLFVLIFSNLSLINFLTSELAKMYFFIILTISVIIFLSFILLIESHGSIELLILLITQAINLIPDTLSSLLSNG